MAKHMLAAALAAIIVALAAWLGLSERLGAHPYWAAKTGLIGAGFGTVVALALAALGLRPGIAFVLGAVLTVLCIALAKLGAARFAASYAEDALAGRFWFLGWVGASAALTMTLLAALRRVIARG